MDDSADGSSNAAQSARADAEEHPPSKPGLLSRLFGQKPEIAAEPVSFGSSQDILAANRGAREMLLNLGKLRDLRVEDILIPRADIISVPDTATLDELVEIFRESALTRLPLFHETLDNPLGLIHLKDLALHHGFGQSDEAFDPAALARPLLYAPPSMSIGVLLQKMQSERIHMALVIDEYGGVDGLVTLEDLVEQIIGEIADEHDADEGDLWVEEAPGIYLAQARAPLQEFEAVIGVDLLSDALDEDVDTLAGLVIMLAGRVPLRGEILVHSQGHEFEIIDADLRQVKRIRVRMKSAVLDQAAE